ncbi:MAG: tetratricopeptide repeat protein, partial [Planctomycetota bacterium]
AVFLLLGCLALLPRAGLPGWPRVLLAALAFAGALLAKETAIAYPAVALILLFTRARPFSNLESRITQPPPARWWLRQAPLLLWPLLFYFPLRYVALGHRLIRSTTDELMNPIAATDGLARLLGPFTVLGHYLRLLLVPARLSCDYGLATLDPRQPFTAMTALGLAAAAALLIGVLCLRRRSPLAQQVGILTALTLVSYALISNAVLLIGVSVAERLMYWPSVPLLMLAGLGLVEFWRRQVAAGGPLAARAGLLRGLALAVVAVLGLRTVVRNADWRDSFTLMEADAATCPRSAHLHYGYALELARRAAQSDDPQTSVRLLRAADRHFTQAVEIHPEYAAALGAHARILGQLGEYEQARRAAETALLFEPAQPDALAVLATLAGQSGSAEERLAPLRAAVAERPDDATARLALGSVLLELGEFPAARAELERAVALAPENDDALRRYGQVLAALDRPADARAVFERVLARAPDDWSTHTNLAGLLARAGDHAGALRHALRAYELKPDDLRVQTNLVKAYIAAGQTDRALHLLRKLAAAFPAGDPRKRVYERQIVEIEEQRR